jgi:hypothetical protein
VIWLRNLAILLACAAASGAQAQIAFRAASSATAATGTVITHVGAGASASRNNCGDINPSIPAGLADDVLIALVNARENGATVAMAGWNQAYADTYPGQEFKVFLFWRRATGGDPNTINQSGNCNSIGAQVARFRGADLAQPLETSPVPAGNVVRQNSGNLDTGSQTTTFNASMLLVAGFIVDNRTITAGAGWTESFDSRLNLSRDLGISLHYQLQTAAGTFSVSNWDLQGGGNDVNYGIMFALRPAPATLTINVPAGTAADDVMIASVSVRPCSNTSGGACTMNVTAPAGWTLVRNVDQTTGAGTGGYGNQLFVYQRVAAAEPAGYTWTISGPPGHAGAVGAIASFQGVDTISPIVAEAGQATGNSFNHAAPSINTGTVTNTMLVATFSDNSAATWSMPGGMTEMIDAASLAVPDTLGMSMAMGYEPLPAAGATGTRTATQSNPPAGDTGATHMLALRPGLHHYSVSPTTATVATCDYVDVTVVAHSASHTAVNAPGGRVVILSTSTGTGVWQAGLVAGTGAWAPSGLNNGAATYTWPGGESGFTVRLRHTTVGALTVNLNDGSAVEDPTEDSSLTFADSALRVSDGAGGPLSIGTQIAGKPSSSAPGVQTLYLQAIRTSPSGACVSLFPSGTEASVDVGAQCNTPATCSQNLTLTSTAAATNTVSFVPNGTYAASMNFRFTTANAEAPFTLNYADAGRITLQFRTLLPAPPANTYISGASNGFVVRPFGFAFSGAARGTDHTSAALVPAGDNFAMTVGAYRWASGQDANNDGVPDAGVDITGNGFTPNFAAVATVEPIANLPGVALGAMTRSIGAAQIAAAEWSGGSAAVADWRYSEVGNVMLQARADDYLGAADADARGNSGNDAAGSDYIGRFHPKRFALTAAPAFQPRFAAGCAGPTFAYMDEDIRVSGFRLEAQNTQGIRTQNYQGLYARHSPAAAATAFGLGVRSGVLDLSARVSAAYVAAPAWLNGLLEAAGNPIAITMVFGRATPDAPDGPYPGAQFGFAPADPDGVALAGYDLDVNNDATMDHLLVGSTGIRYGRLRMHNAVGSEQLALPVPMEVQYWSGTAFVTNGDDSCTSLSRANFTLGSYTPNLNACETILNPAAVTFGGGTATMTLTAPGESGSVLVTANTGSVAAGNYCNAVGGAELPATPAARSYLLGRWNDAANPDGNANTAYDDNPSSRAAFGLFGAQPNNFIYFRENF